MRRRYGEEKIRERGTKEDENGRVKRTGMAIKEGRRGIMAQ